MNSLWVRQDEIKVQMLHLEWSRSAGIRRIHAYCRYALLPDNDWQLRADTRFCQCWISGTKPPLDSWFTQKMRNIYTYSTVQLTQIFKICRYALLPNHGRLPLLFSLSSNNHSERSVRWWWSEFLENTHVTCISDSASHLLDKHSDL